MLVFRPKKEEKKAEQTFLYFHSPAIKSYDGRYVIFMKKHHILVSHTMIQTFRDNKEKVFFVAFVIV